MGSGELRNGPSGGVLGTNGEVERPAPTGRGIGGDTWPDSENGGGVAAAAAAGPSGGVA